MIAFHVEEGSIDDIIDILQQIPEFNNLPDREAIAGRLDGVPHLILIALSDSKIIGCKVGYERDGEFYSWLGAILPKHRRWGVAHTLAEHQENWCRQKAYTSIRMKTRNRFPQMLIMAINRGFKIIHVEPREELRDHRITLQKLL